MGKTELTNEITTHGTVNQMDKREKERESAKVKMKFLFHKQFKQNNDF